MYAILVFFEQAEMIDAVVYLAVSLALALFILGGLSSLNLFVPTLLQTLAVFQCHQSYRFFSVLIRFSDCSACSLATMNLKGQ